MAPLPRLVPAVAIQEIAPLVELGQPDAAMRAVIFHEILSPPQSLREDRETWEM
jgi:hypothetical protein